MLSFSGIIGLVGVSFLRKWQDEKFSNPLFLFAQVQEIILLFISLIAFLIRYDESDFANSWWLIVTAIWILAALFYICSRFLKDKLPFHYLAVISILPIPWVFFHTFGISDRAQYIIFFVWGVILALSGEALKALKNEKFKKYRQPLLFGSVLLIGTASFWGWDESYILGFSILLSGTILYALLNFYRPRLWIWSLTLLFALTSYFAFFDLDGIRSWDFYFGFKLLIPSLFFLLPDIILKNDFKIHPIWHFPPRFLGVLLFFINTAGSLFSIQDNAGKVVLIFGIYAFLTLAYAFRYFSQIAYAANTYFTLIIIYILRSQDAEHWLAPLIALTIAFYLIGWGLERVKNTSRWADVYRYSGLILGALISFSAPFEGTEFLASIPVALAAMLFTVEAFKKRNIWLGFPANALYLMSYFMILMNFDIDQPQFFSVVPAVLGMLMHYLLVRSGSKTAAFSTGMLSQLVLLSTTYVQMVSEERLVYFVVLFFQALAVLVYGIISRSRSMIVTPIVFLIVGVMTITFGLLEGLPTILLIGCTGVFLIIFGIGALLLREKVAGLREKLDKWSALIR